MEYDDKIETLANKQEPSIGGGAGVRAFFVSIFLLMLCFFIVLNNSSTVSAERQKKSLESVKKAFSKNTAPEINLLDEIEENIVETAEKSGQQVNITTPLGEIKNKVKDVLELVNADVAEKGSIMSMALPEERVFIENTENYTEEFKTFQLKLANQAGNANSGTGLEYKVLLDSTKQKLSINRAGKIARDMVKNGIAEQNLITGLSEEADGKVIFIFEMKNRFGSEPIIR